MADFAFGPYGSDPKQHDAHVKTGFDDMANKWENDMRGRKTVAEITAGYGKPGQKRTPTHPSKTLRKEDIGK